VGEVSVLAMSASGAGERQQQLVAAGYSAGAVRIFSLDTGALNVTFNGHRSPVGAARFDRTGCVLATGGRNGDVVLWDVTAERGMYRLRGHRDAVTDVAFVSRSAHAATVENDVAGVASTARALISSSRDGLVKVWDLETQHCVQTLLGHRCEDRQRCFLACRRTRVSLERHGAKAQLE
jgi:U3 small nucleolar RNA-associated protein 12